MDYKKKYYEAQKWIESIYSELSHEQQMEAEASFPELKESEDERIRKELLSFCQNRADNYPNDPKYANIGKWIAWLEKQETSYTKRDVDDAYVEGMAFAKNELEKQGEVTIDIDKMVRDYANNTECGNEEFGKPITCMVRAYRRGLTDALSTLNFKKQGESELKDNKNEKIRKKIIETFKNLGDGKIPVDINYADIFTWLEKQGDKKTTGKVEPFDKYKGLTDFERTLTDICIGWIGEEPGWKQYIKDNADILLKIAIKKFNSVQDVPFEQNPAWTKEDGSNLQGIIYELQANKSEAPEYDIKIYDKFIDWLKSLKQRIGWKPSDEQMDALAWALSLAKNCGEENAFDLRTLYEQLKKLKGE